MKRKRTILIVIVVGAVVLAGVVGIALMRNMMTPAQTKAEQLPNIPLQEKFEVVGQIQAIEGNTLTFEVLEGNGFDVFDQRTGTLLTADRAASKIVMGGEADVKTGAIAQFGGTKTGPDSLQLDRIVILTGYVKGPSN